MSLPLQQTFPVQMFEWATNWIPHDGTGQPVPDHTLCKVMYSNGYVCNQVANACTWAVWTGGRNFWIKPKDDRLWIVAYVVI